MENLNEIQNTQIRVPVHGGYLIAEKNPDSNYSGISILFEAKNGCLIDIVTAECKAENDNKITDVYCYENIYDEDWTRKFSLSNEEMVKVTED